MATKSYKFKWQPNFQSETNYPVENWIPRNVVKAITYDDTGYAIHRTERVFIITNEELEKYPKFWLRNIGSTPCVIVVPDAEQDFKHNWGEPYKFFHSKDFVVCKVCQCEGEGHTRWERFSTYGTRYRCWSDDAKDYAVLVPLDNQVKSSQKIFTSFEEMQAVSKAADEKAKAKRAAEKALKEETNNGPIDFATPVFEIVEINKSTDIVYGAKVGDTLQGKIKMLNADGENLMSRPKSSYVSYVDLYLNGNNIKSLPMNVFSTMMAFNFKLKQK